MRGGGVEEQSGIPVLPIPVETKVARFRKTFIVFQLNIDTDCLFVCVWGGISLAKLANTFR